MSNFLFKCVECDAESGEYQDKEGQSFCQVVNPGHELPVDKDGTAGTIL